MLEQQIGAEEWAKLSEKDRQKKLMQTKLRERQLRAAGRESFGNFLCILGGSVNQHDSVVTADWAKFISWGPFHTVWLGS